MATSKDNKQLVLDENCKTKPDILYPTSWSYKLIGRDLNLLIACVKEIMGEKKHSCTVGNTSKTGKFTTYNTTCIVASEEERNKIFKHFETHDATSMVI